MSRTEYAGAAPETVLTSSMTAGSPAAGQTFTIESGTGYPTGSVGNFVLAIDRGTASEEKILCSSRSGTTVTVAPDGRGWDGTTAVSHGGGVTTGTVLHVIDAASLTDNQDHIYDTGRDDHTQYLLTSAAPELIRDTMGTALTAGAGITITPSDPSDIITITNSAVYPGIATVAAAMGASATVASAQTTTSTSYADLSTPGPAVTLDTSTAVLVAVTAELNHNSIRHYFSYAVSGATTVSGATNDTAGRRLLFISADTYADCMHTAFFVHTGLTAGSNTFTAKYKVDSGTGTFGFRTIYVTRLN